MKNRTIPSNQFINTREKLATNLKENSVALVFSAHQMPRNGDQYYAYRQHSDFFYLTGIEQEKSALLICNHPEAKDLQEILFILKPNKELETWEGHKLTIEEAQEISGIKTIRFIDEFNPILHSLLCITNTIYFNLSQNQKFKSEVRSRDFDMLNQIVKEYPAHTVEKLAPILEKLRLKKSAQEIDLMRKACSITKDAFVKVMQTIGDGMMEYEVEAEVIYEFIRKGANGHAYAPIIANGANACFLHYIDNKSVCKEGDLVLMDFGAEYANYAADLSRTIPVNGKFTARQREMYDSTLRVFKFARSLMVPGTTINKLHKEVCIMAQEEHIRLGLYTQKDVEENKAQTPLWFNYFMHGTGHFLGLDVHDVGTRDTILEPGMVLTCEPGLYIPKENTGIRIENNILITENGNEDLMADIPIEIEEIESIMGE